MKKIFLGLVFCLLSLVLFAWPKSGEISAPSGSMWGWDDASGTWKPIGMSGTGKLVSDVPSTAQTLVITLSTTTFIIPPISNRKSILIAVIDFGKTIWLTAGGATVAVGAGIPVSSSYSADADSDIQFKLIASESVKIAIEQKGR